MNRAFTEAEFDLIDAGCRASADAVVPLLPMFGRVVDVGCGRGHWGAAFAARGAAVVGVEREADARIEVVAHDLREPLPPLGTFDLAICLEVAEHLPAHCAPRLVSELCELAPVVLFSAAIPWQGGIGHENEQWPAYWSDLFDAHGFHVSGALRWKIWTDERVENWYRQNMMICTSQPERFPEYFDTPLAPMWPVVHPILFEARAS